MIWLTLLAGLVLLVAGAEALVRGAGSLAGRFGLSPLVIGLTVVAIGTSSPEIAVSLQGAWSGQGDVTVGNVVGSNIFNTLAILGASALVAPLVVDSRVVRLDVPVMILATGGVFAMAADGRFGRIDGTILTAGAVAYLASSIWRSRRESAAAAEGDETRPAEAPGPGPWPAAVMTLGGLAILVLGANWFVDGAVSLATAADIDPLVVSLTVVAAGTSLPELATSALAARRGARDIAVGNVVGSNLFNLLGVLGLSALVSPQPIAVPAQTFHFDLPVLLATSVACLPFLVSRYALERWEGGLFVGYYLAYTTYLVFAATDHPLLGEFRDAMLLFVLPLTAVTIGVVTVRLLRERETDRP